MSDLERSAAGSSANRFPPKPTRESATASETPGEATAQRQEPAGAEPPLHMGRGREANPAGPQAAERDAPYVPNEDRGAEVQEDIAAPADVPVSPANASGFDKLTPDEQNDGIDEESMYDRRPERDKDRPPSQRE